MTDPVNTPATPAAAAAPAAPVVPVAPAPDSPEYAAYMAARAEQNTLNPEIKTDPATPTPQSGDPAEKKDPVDPNAPTPKLTDDPNKESPKEGEQPKPADGAYDFAKAFNDGSIVNDFNAAETPKALVDGLAKALGVTDAEVKTMVDQFKLGQQALASAAESQLFEAAGGKDQFNEVIKWGQANLSPSQKEFYERQLNGPDAIATVQLLRDKMLSTRDPNLVNVNGERNSAVAGFRDQSEMMVAMSDPRYQVSEAYRREVAARLQVSRF
jgi:hypothetical protein